MFCILECWQSVAFHRCGEWRREITFAAVVPNRAAASLSEVIAPSAREGRILGLRAGKKRHRYESASLESDSQECAEGIWQLTCYNVNKVGVDVDGIFHWKTALSRVVVERWNKVSKYTLRSPAHTRGFPIILDVIKHPNTKEHHSLYGSSFWL